MVIYHPDRNTIGAERDKKVKFIIGNENTGLPETIHRNALHIQISAL